jgi:hypothetical protein
LKSKRVLPSGTFPHEIESELKRSLV